MVCRLAAELKIPRLSVGCERVEELEEGGWPAVSEQAGVERVEGYHMAWPLWNLKFHDCRLEEGRGICERI